MLEGAWIIDTNRNPGVFTPINRKTAAQSVADQILGMIRNGSLRPGDQLPAERELIEMLKVGRSSVREALQILSTLQVVQVVPGHGTFVKELQAADLLRTDVLSLLISNSMAFELYEARQTIEPTVARLSALRARPEELEKIEVLLDAHSEALARGEEVREYAIQFHVLLARAAHNRVLENFVEVIHNFLKQRGRHLERVPDYLEREIREHREILALIQAGNEDGAAEAMLAHIINAAPLYHAREEELT